MNPIQTTALNWNGWKINLLTYVEDTVVNQVHPMGLNCVHGTDLCESQYCLLTDMYPKTSRCVSGSFHSCLHIWIFYIHPKNGFLIVLATQNCTQGGDPWGPLILFFMFFTVKQLNLYISRNIIILIILGTYSGVLLTHINYVKGILYVILM